MEKTKALVIMGTVWDFWDVLKVSDEIFDATYLSFYKPWIVEGKKKVIAINESNPSLLKLPLRLFRRWSFVFNAINKTQAKIVIVHHDDAALSIIPVIILSKILNKKTKFVAFIRGGLLHYKQPFSNRVVVILGRLFYGLFDVLITGSDANRRDLEGLFKHKFEFINNPANIETISKRAKEKLDDRVKNKKYILFIGRLALQKAPWMLIRALAPVLKKYDYNLAIIGTGGLEQDTKERCKYAGISDRVIFLGQQPNVYPFLLHARMLVLPSIWESFGQVIIESLSVGTQVIAADCKSGPREIIYPSNPYGKIKYPLITNNGILIEPLTSTKLPALNEELNRQEKMLRDIVAKELQKKHLFKPDLTRFSLSFVAQRSSEIFNKLLSQK